MIKKMFSDILGILIQEHSKLFLIILVSVFSLMIIFSYKHPSPQELSAAPIQYLPQHLGNWRGTKIESALLFKNNKFNSTLYLDGKTNFELYFLSYQRRNERYDLLHYPEDCLRSLSIFNFQENFIPLQVNGRTIIFKRLWAENSKQIIVHYYAIISKTGDIQFYKTGKFSVAKLFAQRLNFQHSEDQLFRFTTTIEKTNPAQIALIDQKIQEFIQLLPVEFWPQKS